MDPRHRKHAQMTARQQTAAQLARCAEVHEELMQSNRAMRAECRIQRRTLRRLRTRLDWLPQRHHAKYAHA